MITYFSDLTPAERSVLAQAAREQAEISEAPARWEQIVKAIENGGKQPHGVKPSAWRVVGDQPKVEPFRIASAYVTSILDAGTGGPC
ncbi:hypothetical protein ACIOD2_27200 [Amycolatopsis sp. NPDC088138]|uniref:hypothetical protein n=1 Tax=Amycolatopsis sp. NPDC088138 TaxID=3363938 RepID=UPI0037F88394